MSSQKSKPPALITLLAEVDDDVWWGLVMVPATLRETHRAVVFHEAAEVFVAFADDRLRSLHRDERRTMPTDITS